MTVLLENVGIMPQTKTTRTFAEFLSSARKDAGLTQLELANAVTDLGQPITDSRISQLEKAVVRRRGGAPTRPSIELVDALCEALGADKNEARTILNYPSVEDEDRDADLDGFAFELRAYQQLTPSDKKFIRDQLRRWVRFCLDIRKETEYVDRQIDSWTVPGGKGGKFLSIDDPKIPGKIEDYDEQVQSKKKGERNSKASPPKK